MHNYILSCPYLKKTLSNHPSYGVHSFWKKLQNKFPWLIYSLIGKHLPFRTFLNFIGRQVAHRYIWFEKFWRTFSQLNLFVFYIDVFIRLAWISHFRVLKYLSSALFRENILPDIPFFTMKTFQLSKTACLTFRSSMIRIDN